MHATRWIGLSWPSPNWPTRELSIEVFFQRRSSRFYRSYWRQRRTRVHSEWWRFRAHHQQRDERSDHCEYEILGAHSLVPFCPAGRRVVRDRLRTPLNRLTFRSVMIRKGLSAWSCYLIIWNVIRALEERKKPVWVWDIRVVETSDSSILLFRHLPTCFSFALATLLSRISPFRAPLLCLSLLHHTNFNHTLKDVASLSRADGSLLNWDFVLHLNS